MIKHRNLYTTLYISPHFYFLVSKHHFANILKSSCILWQLLIITCKTIFANFIVDFGKTIFKIFSYICLIY